MKKYPNKNSHNWLCSGYGVFPDGSKCLGCNDCKGKAPKTYKEIKKVFDGNHTTITVGKNFDLEKELKKHVKKHRK